jgi:hypothetical protein
MGRARLPAVPLKANNDAGFSPAGTRRQPEKYFETHSMHLQPQSEIAGKIIDGANFLGGGQWNIRYAHR